MCAVPNASLPFSCILPCPATGQNAAKGTQGKTVGLVLNTLFSRWKKRKGEWRGHIVSGNQPTKELTEGGNLCESVSQRPSVCLAIPAWLGSVTDTLNCNWDGTYANDFPSSVSGVWAFGLNYLIYLGYTPLG